MSGTIGRALTAVFMLVLVTSPAAAQQLPRFETAVGGVVAGYGPAGGVYLDAGVRVLPTTSLLGEIQVVQSNSTELAALGGVRQLLFNSRQGQIYVQFLVGAATGYSSRCDLCHTRAADFGVGGNVKINDRWAVNVRGDIRVGGAAADLPLPMFGAGITRTWGAR